MQASLGSGNRIVVGIAHFGPTGAEATVHLVASSAPRARLLVQADCAVRDERRADGRLLTRGAIG